MPGEYTKSGTFLTKAVGSDRFLIPEQFDDELKMVADTTDQFIMNEVMPASDEIEHKNYEKLVALVRKAGEIGLLNTDIPEEFGGMGGSKTMTMVVADRISGNASFVTTFSAHNGIGTLPLLFFGTQEQKEKYLPRLATAEIIGAYALTEPTSGSDALGAKCKAVLSDDGKYYILDGVKQFITNGAFADLFTVFAKIDGDKFTGFLVEKSFEGVSVGPEEDKIGIRGSSTTQVILESAKVPVENVLGEIGKGHKIAFNVLNVGRFKLGAHTLGGTKRLVGLSTKYAAERKQFDTPIIKFPLIREKIANMTIEAYAAESIVYRVAGYMDQAIDTLDKNDENYWPGVLKAIEEYALEDSMIKVFCSECLDRAADEGVQIHGGYGFVEEYEVAKVYRDSRINRIFEGTNEVNRLLIPATLLKRAMKGDLPLLEMVQQLAGIVDGNDEFDLPGCEHEALDAYVKAVEAAKRALIYTTGIAAQKYMQELEKEQELLRLLADMLTDLYAADSALTRAIMLTDSGDHHATTATLMAQAFTIDAIARVRNNLHTSWCAMARPEKAAAKLQRLNELIPSIWANAVAIKREVADKVEEIGEYPLRW